MHFNLERVYAYFKLPLSIKRKVMTHFLMRFFGRRSSNHQIIWTSVYYFSLKENLSVQAIADKYLVILNNAGTERRCLLRKEPSSDVFVFFQIRIRQEYNPLFGFIKARDISVRSVVDAGANIGLFSIIAHERFEFALIHAIEPDPLNFEIMCQNIELNQLRSSIVTHQSALWFNSSDTLDIIKDTDWSSRVSKSSAVGRGTVQTVAVGDIIAQSGWPHIDLLKLDVEGTEGVLFDDATFLQELSRIKIIAIEIHDQLCSRARIYTRLRESNFDYFDSGEMTVAWNRKLVG